MTEVDPVTERPNVLWNATDGSAQFHFRKQKYLLPGTFPSYWEALQSAEDYCRQMGWKG